MNVPLTNCPFFVRKNAQGRLRVIACIACYSRKLSIYKTIAVPKHLMSQTETEKHKKEIVVGT